MITIINNTQAKDTGIHCNRGSTFIKDGRLYCMIEQILSSHVGYDAVCLGPIEPQNIVTSMDEPGRLDKAVGIVVPVDIEIHILPRAEK